MVRFWVSDMFRVAQLYLELGFSLQANIEYQYMLLRALQFTVQNLLFW